MFRFFDFIPESHHTVLVDPLFNSFLRADLLSRVEAELGRTLSDEERAAAADDTHAGLWETSIMLGLRPDLGDPGVRDLPAAR